MQAKKKHDDKIQDPRHKAKTPSSPLAKGELSNADTSALENRIDEMIYALYGLSPDEFAIVEGRR